MNKIVVSVGAGYTQTPFIEKIKERGYKVASFGMGRNDPKAIELSDYFKEINTSDYQSAISWLESLPCEIIGAGSFAGGVAIETLQKIDRHFNLPTQIPEYLTVGMDKYHQQKLYEKYELSSIGTYKVADVLEDEKVIDNSKHYICKPTIGRGSAGVYKLKGDELIQFINREKFSKDDLIQEFKEGKEYRLLLIIQEKKIKLLAAVNRESLDNTFLLGRLQVENENYELLKEYFEKLISNTGLSNAIIKTDVIINNNIIDMIEMDIGVGGGLYYKKFIETAFNFDISNIYIDLIVNKAIKKIINEDSNNYVMDYIYNYKGQKIKYDENTISEKLKEIVGEHKIVRNLLKPENKNSFETNADFIITIIHKKHQIKNKELNVFINKEFFEIV